ncbi:MAG TPA: FMN-binding negative transcriptional regulator [Gemmataceae bacterium]|nr:FMN-binding negative transcriptional regulator [Gemmataceae bacterium]
MYIPNVFTVTDATKLHDFIEANSFGLLVSMHGGEPFATHLPFLLERDAGPHGRLVGHMARANPHWNDLDGRTVLAVFSGPHAYVSPTWYESENVVPTWNYVAVHAYGICRTVTDSEELAEILKAMVATYERSLPKPWPLDAAGDYIQKQMRAVVGFRIEIGRLEGKWKLNQNHPPERRDNVIRVLEQSPDQDAREIARLMAEMRDYAPGFKGQPR